MKFFSNTESNELRKFFDLDLVDKEIVFYSEDKNSMIIFDSIIDELINNYNVKICYVTSSEEELNLISKNKNIKAFYIGDGIVRTKFFLELKARILIMTMPDLGTFHIKRSKIYPVHYLYMFHAMLSTHMVYRKNAFDQFDTIFCVGPYQIKEIEETEKKYNLKPKNLIKFGYNHLDNLLEKYSEKSDDHKEIINQVIIAPSWGKNGLFETVIEEVIDTLLKSGLKTVLRPHPMSQKKSKKRVIAIQKKYSSNPNFILETNIPNFESLKKSDIMISDWSGVALEFAFVFEKPIIFIDVPKKINNSDYEKISLIPIEENIRDKIGIVLKETEINLLTKKIFEIHEHQLEFKEKIKKIREETIFNIGQSTKIGAENIIKLLNEL